MERSEPKAKTQSILDAATRTFLAAGFGAVSMDTIAREAGVSKATVYAHFAGKEDLFGAMIGRVCERRFGTFSATELDAADARRSLTILGRRFLELLLSPEAIALHRIIIGEVARFPLLGDVFWRAGPERNYRQIEAFMRRAAACGALHLADPRSAAEQFVGLVRGERQLRHLLKLDSEASAAAVESAVAAAVDTFLRAFGPARPG